MQAEAKIIELNLINGFPAARILCPPKMIPAPGQYLQAFADGSDSPLAASVFAAKIYSDGFLVAPPIPKFWLPGTPLHLRGPLGHGFNLPVTAKRVALIAFDDFPARLMPLIDLAFRQETSLVLVCDSAPDDLPLQVEVQPLCALRDIFKWADYVALDAARESLPGLKEMLGMLSSLEARSEAQILVRAPMPCGTLAACGVCAVKSRRCDLLICDDGPVLNLWDLNF